MTVATVLPLALFFTYERPQAFPLCLKLSSSLCSQLPRALLNFTSLAPRSYPHTHTPTTQHVGHSTVKL